MNWTEKESSCPTETTHKEEKIKKAELLNKFGQISIFFPEKIIFFL